MRCRSTACIRPRNLPRTDPCADNYRGKRAASEEGIVKQNAKRVPTALGFRVKSGWAQAVVLAGPVESPRVLSCHAALLSDPAEPNSKQPYHVALELPEKEASSIVRRLRQLVARAAQHSVAGLLNEAESADCAVCGAGIVVGSLIDPASLHNAHIRAHAWEGQLFRTVLEEAFLKRKIPCRVLVEKSAYATAAAEMGKTKAQLVKLAAQLGASHNGSWRAEEKLAALAALFVLTKNSLV
jgi:hypothetical protein